jgi:type I restriction enzyme, R subunit
MTITYNMVASMAESTVVAEYVREAAAAYEYQSEVALEQEFISQLESQGYKYLQIHDEAALIANGMDSSKNPLPMRTRIS